MRKKTSFGLICARHDGPGRPLSFAVMRKRHTYAFQHLVMGDYGTGDWGAISKLLAQTTAQEKVILYSCNWDFCWYVLWPSGARSAPDYPLHKWRNLMAERAKWEAAIKEAPHGNTFWELPKGRNERGETGIGAATRELEEETGILPRSYRVVDKKWCTDHADGNVRYIVHYWLAIANKAARAECRGIAEPEVAECRWMNVAEVVAADFHPRVRDTITSANRWLRKNRQFF